MTQINYDYDPVPMPSVKFCDVCNGYWEYGNHGDVRYRISEIESADIKIIICPRCKIARDLPDLSKFGTDSD